MNVCPSCGAENPEGASFCNNCGNRLQSSTPPTELGAERRVVTILFCDVKGSTAAADRLDPEEWAEIMSGVFEIMTRPVEKFGGTVARLMGDAVLAFFGAPTSHEDDPERAVLAGLEIVEGAMSYSEKVRQRWGIEVGVRVGINTGLVRVGAIGSEVMAEYTAIGDAVNVAARMEQTAEPGTVQITEDTYRLTDQTFEFLDLGELEVKGKDLPVRIYRPIRQRSDHGSRRGIKGLEAHLVGRERELDQLRRAVAHLQRGVGGIIGMIGEAGLGKSRLIGELRREAGDPIGWHETAALSYEATQAYAPIRRLLRSQLPGPNDLASLIADVERRSAVQVLLEGGVSPTDGETFNRHLLAGVGDLWTRLSAERPAAIVFDDVHWADNASVALVEHLLPLTEAVPLLLIFASRPDRDAPGWRIKERAELEHAHRYIELALRPLADAEADQLVGELLNVANIPPEARRHIVERTDGNPFFLEEVIRSLLDRGVLQRVNGGYGWQGASTDSMLDLPESVQALLTARIDRLAGPLRRTLQVAAVIGRSFYRSLIGTVDQTQLGDLDERLGLLQRAELIDLAARFPETEYEFRHILTQEAAYQTILIKERRQYHRRVAEAILDLFGDQVDRYSAILAHHFNNADDPRALTYEHRAGDAAFSLYALDEARGHYRRALQAAASHPELADDDFITEVHLRLGRTQELMNDYPGALRTYEDLDRLAAARASPRMELQAALAAAIAFGVPTQAQDPDQSERRGIRALELARSQRDPAAESRALWALAMQSMYRGRLRAALEPGNESVAIARREGLREQLAQSLTDVGRAHLYGPDLAAARAAVGEARLIWEELGNIPMICECLTIEGNARAFAGDFGACLELHKQAIELATRIGNEWSEMTAYVTLDLTFRTRGWFQRVLDETPRLLEKADRLGHPVGMMLRGERALTLMALGAYPQAIDQAQELVTLSEKYPRPFKPVGVTILTRLSIRVGDLGMARRYVGLGQDMAEIDTPFDFEMQRWMARIEFMAADGKEKEARRLADKYVSLLTSSGVEIGLGEAHVVAGLLASESGDDGEAASHALEGLTVAERIGARDAEWRLLALLARVDPDNAADHRAIARAVVGALAADLTDHRLRATFEEMAMGEIERGYPSSRPGIGATTR